MDFGNLFVVVHPTHILVHPRVLRAHWLKSTVLEDDINMISVFVVLTCLQNGDVCCYIGCILSCLWIC